MNMDKETEQTLNYLPLGQSDPFGNVNDGTIGDFIGRYCNPQEISPLTLQSFSLNSQISENFPISGGGIRFPPYPGQFGSDREFSVLGSQPTAQDSNKSSLLDPDSVSAVSDPVHPPRRTVSSVQISDASSEVGVGNPANPPPLRSSGIGFKDPPQRTVSTQPPDDSKAIPTRNRTIPTRFQTRLFRNRDS